MVEKGGVVYDQRRTVDNGRQKPTLRVKPDGSLDAYANQLHIGGFVGSEATLEMVW